MHCRACYHIFLSIYFFSIVQNPSSYHNLAARLGAIKLIIGLDPMTLTRNSGIRPSHGERGVITEEGNVSVLISWYKHIKGNCINLKWKSMENLTYLISIRKPTFSRKASETWTHTIFWRYGYFYISRLQINEWHFCVYRVLLSIVPFRKQPAVRDIYL